MNFPTLLGPWYVVQRESSGRIEFYMSECEAGDDRNYWTEDAKRACLFMSLKSAARVANAEVADVRVLYSKEGAKEFGRD